MKNDRNPKDGYVWNSFCTKSPSPALTCEFPMKQVVSEFVARPSENNSKIRVLTDKDIKGIIDTAVHEVTRYNPKAKSPLLGPAWVKGRF